MSDLSSYLSSFLKIETQVLVKVGSKINVGEDFTVGVFVWNLNSDGMIFKNAVVTIEDSDYAQNTSSRVQSIGDVRGGYVQIAVTYHAKKAIEQFMPFPWRVDGIPEPLGKITVEADVEWNITGRVAKTAQPFVQISK